ncbi:MAG: peptidase domain-containing ABC transporter, partial [Alphaproteobacteria bacterium]
IGVGLLGLATPIAVQALVNSVAMGGIRQPLLVLAFMLFVFLAFSGLLRVMQAWLVEIIQRRIFARIAADLAWRLPRVTQEVHDRAHGAELVNRFFEVMTVQKAAATLLLDGVATLLQAVIGLVVLAFYNPVLLAFDFAIVLCMAGVIFLLGRGATETAIAESRAKYAVAAWLEAVARNQRTFKLYGGPEHAEERADLLSHSYLHARGRHYRVVFRQNVALAALSAVAGTSILAIGGVLVMEGQLTLGQLVAAELIVTSVLSSFSKFGKQLESYYDLLAASDKLGHLVDLPLEPEGDTDPASFREPRAIALEIDDLEFAHDGSDPLFSGLSLDVQPGERVAIVGPEGSGKGTLAEILVGLRRPGRGTVRMNGFDLRELRLEEVRKRIALVSDPEILEGTVLENVRLGRSDVGHEEVAAALGATGLLASMRALPDGMQTRLVPGGSPLSGGQVQRLLVARALVGSPGLVIVDTLLDELDDRDRDEAMDALLDPNRSFTLLLLTRSSILARRCDRIVRLQHGRLATGTETPR